MNDILNATIKKARKEIEQQVVSENMVGIDYLTLSQYPAIVNLVAIKSDYGFLEMEFKKGEW